MLLRSARPTLASICRLFSAAAATVDTATEAVVKPRSGGGGGATNRKETVVGGRDTLGGRLLSLVYTKRSAVVTIRKWKEEGHSVRKYELNRIVRELRKIKRYKHALEVRDFLSI